MKVRSGSQPSAANLTFIKVLSYRPGHSPLSSVLVLTTHKPSVCVSSGLVPSERGELADRPRGEIPWDLPLFTNSARPHTRVRVRVHAGPEDRTAKLGTTPGAGLAPPSSTRSSRSRARVHEGNTQESSKLVDTLPCST